MTSGEFGRFAPLDLEGISDKQAYTLASMGILGGEAFVATLPLSLAGPDYVDYQGNLYPISELAAFINTPKGKQWLASGDMGESIFVGASREGTPLGQYRLGDWRPFAEFRQTVLGITPTGGIAPTYRAYGAPTPRYGGVTPTPSLATEYYRFMEEQRAKVSPPRYRYMESIFPELERKFKAVTEIKARKEEAKISPIEWLKKYPFKEEFGRLPPYERGFRPQFQPSIRTVNF